MGDPAPETQRPTFARSFPREPRLDRLVQLFEQGNHAAVRKDAHDLLRATEDAELRAAARELLKRLEPDPLAVTLVVIAALLLATLSIWYWSHPHETPPPGPPARPKPAAPASS